MFHGMFDSLALRSLLAVITAFAVALVSARFIIAWLKRLGWVEHTGKTPIEDESLRKQIEAKSGTPTMGGLIVLLGLLSSLCLWGDMRNVYLVGAIFCTAALAVLGMVDDYLKLVGAGRAERGLKARHKLLVQFAVGGAAGLIIWRPLSSALGARGVSLMIPFTGGRALYLGVGFIAWVALIVAMMSNATNITDGLDGLAPGLTILVAPVLAIAAGVAGRAGGAARLGIPPVAGAEELAVFCAALCGALLAFLWYNSHPAEVFMGDTGALAVGGGLGLVAVVTKQELLLPLLALLLLAELASSLLQILWFKLTGKRILPIAPMHHIFTKRGWPETKIVARYYITGAVCAVASLILLSI